MKIEITKFRQDSVLDRDIEDGVMKIEPADEYGKYVEIDGQKINTEELIQALKAIKKPELCSHP